MLSDKESRSFKKLPAEEFSFEKILAIVLFFLPIWSNSNKRISEHPHTTHWFFSFIVFLSFYSPVILAVSVVSLSFIFQNFKGFIYLGFLLACCVIREFIYKWSGSNPSTSDGTICTSIQYSKYGNPAFSAFVFAFTIHMSKYVRQYIIILFWDATASPLRESKNK